jgi:hypothetical protein
MKQLALFDHAGPAKRSKAQVPVLERLHRVLQRRGIDPNWRRTPGTVRRSWILPLCGLDCGDRLRIGTPQPGERGLPAQGAWETLCAWHVNAADQCPEDRYDYAGRHDPGVDLKPWGYGR